jgi:predicted AlkP superfamily pyrophosphatase or phosphodiesterase
VGAAARRGGRVSSPVVGDQRYAASRVAWVQCAGRVTLLVPVRAPSPAEIRAYVCRQRSVFAGDDTWMALFPGVFTEQHPFPSFNVWDLDTVDNGAAAILRRETAAMDGGGGVTWRLLVAHMLGVDHAGHTYGMHSRAIPHRLAFADAVVGDVMDALDNDTLLVVLGDHGEASVVLYSSLCCIDDVILP